MRALLRPIKPYLPPDRITASPGAIAKAREARPIDLSQSSGYSHRMAKAPPRRRLFDPSKPPLKRLTSAQVQASTSEAPEHVGAPLAKSGDTITRHYQHTELDWSEFDAPGAAPIPQAAFAPPQNVSQPIAKSDDTIIRHYQGTELDWSEFDAPAPGAAPTPQRQALLKGNTGSGSGMVDMIQRLGGAPPEQQGFPIGIIAEPVYVADAKSYTEPPRPLPLAKSDLAGSFGELSASLTDAASMVADLHKAEHTARVHPQLRTTRTLSAAQARELGRHSAAPQMQKSSSPFDDMMKAVHDATETFTKKGLL